MPQAWSYSLMKDFLTCPRKCKAEKIDKLYPFTETEHTRYGNEVHKVAELYVGSDKPIPQGHMQFKPALDVLKNKPGTKHCELQMATNHDKQPTEWFGRDVRTRYIIDLLVLDGDKATIVDYKTGSAKYPDKDQLELMSLATFIHYPEVHRVKAGLIFLCHDVLVKDVYNRSDAERLWEKWDARDQQLQDAVENDNFPPKTNGLCRKWCPVKTCEFNGG